MQLIALYSYIGFMTGDKVKKYSLAVKEHILFIMRDKKTILTFFVLFGLVFIHFIENVLDFQGRDVLAMYHPMKILLLSYNMTNYNVGHLLILIQLYPVLLVFPAGLSLAADQQTGQEIFMVARLGKFNYQMSKLAAAYISTFIIFTVPFLVEILLNCLAFPLEAAGDLWGFGIYEEQYIRNVQLYLMSDLYEISPYLYAIAGTLLFGGFSGLLSAFTVAFSSLVRVRYKVFLFLPVFILLNFTLYASALRPAASESIRWCDYMLLFNDEVKSVGYLICFVAALIIFSVAAIWFSSRKDCIQ